MAFIECVPNFSEGRRAEVIAQIVEVIPSEAVYLLDVSSDRDHNRTVVTFAGEPEAVASAMLRAARRAIELIDLNLHEGVHPRIGAVDVVPFIPLAGISLESCVLLAQEFGRTAAAELGLPVYLYEAAALNAARRNLADIRRGGYEVLRETIVNDPSRKPDYGPTELPRYGATVVGARKPLIAFNAYLDTEDVEIARLIAEQIRESGGGLKYLKALGLLVNGQAQVSMNVIDYTQTSLYAVVSAVRAAAAAHGRRITHTELVGLAPQAALLAYAAESLQLDSPVRQHLLEYRLGSFTGDYRELSFE